MQHHVQVEWQRSDIKWASRWDVYLEMADTQIHWFSIINSVVVVFFLSGIITMIIIRTLRRDIAKYNMAEEDLEEEEHSISFGTQSSVGKTHSVVKP